MWYTNLWSSRSKCPVEEDPAEALGTDDAEGGTCFGSTGRWVDRELPGIGMWRVGLKMFKVFFGDFWLILGGIYGNMSAVCAPNILLECVWTILNPPKPVSNTVWESVWNHRVWICFIKRSAKKIKKTFWTWPTKIRGWLATCFLVGRVI